MYESVEMRWFMEASAPAIESWFANRGLTFSNTASRTDHYLPLAKADIGVKLREGRIEVKHRQDVRSGHFQLTRDAQGQMEEYVKWSFGLDDQDRLASQILEDKPAEGNWTKVVKTRLGVKLARNGVAHPLSEPLTSACQVEYTRITLGGSTWFTFGLEWFGQEWVEVPDTYWATLLSNMELAPAMSMGYAEFLARKT